MKPDQDLRLPPLITQAIIQDLEQEWGLPHSGHDRVQSFKRESTGDWRPKPHQDHPENLWHRFSQDFPKMAFNLGFVMIDTMAIYLPAQKIFKHNTPIEFTHNFIGIFYSVQDRFGVRRYETPLYTYIWGIASDILTPAIAIPERHQLVPKLMYDCVGFGYHGLRKTFPEIPPTPPGYEDPFE